MNYVFIILTADNCGACTNFKGSQLNKLLDLSKMIKNVTTININVKDRNNNDCGDRYHPQFRKRFGCWYPSFYLFAEKDFYTFNKPLQGKTLGGTFDKGNMKLDNTQKFSFEANFVINWIKSNIDNDKNVYHHTSSSQPIDNDSECESCEEFNIL